MTDRLKCPICGGEMIGNLGSPICHYNQDCPIHDRSIPQEIYDLLERTRKALDVATGFIKGISQTVINDCDNQYVVLGNFKKFALDTLNQIKTALEQTDVK